MPFHGDVTDSQFEIVELLLNMVPVLGSCLDVLFQHVTQIHSAVENNHFEIVELLIQNGALLNQSCLLYVSRHCQLATTTC